uniref:Retrovirus-related Pol polyprotein from transposon TNT 1-94 n=1 Tax=Cajanus cajan TaxID=3821 RepID=A0A151S7T4_CAJCA|nr:Retrovirus-related Pol polyprotein from transposon TNT 1-94 [Cajanus cajan]
MLIFGTCDDIVFKTKFFLASNFDMKDMGEASVILGGKVVRKGDSILLSQGHYVERLLKKFDYYDCKSVTTPYDVNSQLNKIKESLLLNLSMPKL